MRISWFSKVSKALLSECTHKARNFKILKSLLFLPTRPLINKIDPLESIFYNTRYNDENWC